MFCFSTVGKAEYPTYEENERNLQSINEGKETLVNKIPHHPILPTLPSTIFVIYSLYIRDFVVESTLSLG